MNVFCILLMAFAGSAGAAIVSPQVRFTVSPSVIKGGDDVVVTIPAFGREHMLCHAIIVGADCESNEAPCGTQEAVLRMRPTILSMGKVTINVSACTLSRHANNANNECWSYEKDLDSGLRRTAGGSSASPAKAAPAPAPGGLGDDAAPPLLRSAPAPAAPSSARISRGWTAESASQGAEPEAKPASRQFRGHDGKVYVREEPPKESVAAKDEKFRKAVAADPAVRAAYADWRNLDDNARQAALQRVSDIQSSVYGIEPSPVLLKSGMQPPSKVAEYSRGDRTMTINKSNPYYNSPSMQLNAVSHESRHRWQHALVLKLPSLPDGSEERALAVAFKVSFDNYCSVGGKPACDYATYRNQLVERDAFEYGEAAALHLRGQKR